MNSRGSDGEVLAPAQEPEPELVRPAPATTAVVRGVVPMAGLRDFFDASFRELARVMAAQGIAPTGPAFGLYHGAPGRPWTWRSGSSRTGRCARRPGSWPVRFPEGGSRG